MNAFRKAFGAKLKRLDSSGYTFHFDPEGRHSPGDMNWSTVTANHNGKQVGRMEVGEEGGFAVPHGTKVHPDHQRKGVASAMYRHYETTTGHKLNPDHTQTPAAKALWANKGRPFGKLVKSPYGPAGMGLYSDADNARRKMNRASLSATKPTVSQQASQLAAADKARSKKNPVKIYSPQEIQKLFRGGFKRPKAA